MTRKCTRCNRKPSGHNKIHDFHTDGQAELVANRNHLLYKTEDKQRVIVIPEDHPAEHI